ncbi:phage major capsid protein [Sandarakinorhabdus sp.]|uniref:phage major capsid protein n=1 Tax=Sandarakinorhabdus sp. TaxID=1916663 RepID=UPI0028AC0916|nr:phage major capsid protein [Sandarakinorhabdus sp.]
MSTEIKALLDEQGKVFDAFKSKVDQELAGKADAVVADEIKKLNDALDSVQAKLREAEIKAARPTGDAAEEAARLEAKNAFADYARKGVVAEGFEAKSVTTSVNADGGFALPKIIDPVTQRRLVDISPVRSVARVVQASGRDFRILLNRRGMASGWVGETSARPETNTPVLQEITPPSGDLYANPAVSQWALNDLSFDVAAFVAENVELEMARAEAAAFITGDGSNKPQGFIKGTPVTTADSSRAAGVLQYIASGQAAALPTSIDIYIDMVASLKAGHRPGAIWMMSKSSVAAIRKLKATDNQYLWQPSTQAGAPATFLGYAVAEAEDMPAVAANAFPIAFGNFFAGYTILEIGTTNVIRDPYTNKPYTMFYSSKRVGGDLVDSEAIKVLKIATT